MDYSLCSAVSASNTQEISKMIILYDINCQYHVNFYRRVNKNPGVEFPAEKTVYWGIGEFHVTAHIPECFPRHSPQFIPGAGHVDGEILESLWSTLKDVFPSTHTATITARSELLDDHIQDSNWKKLVNISKSVNVKLERC
jgi:KDZ transposase-like protein